jgi:hypothetical protein
MSKLPRAPRGSRESGYAMIVALIMVATFIIGSQVVLQHFATEGRRQREQRMIWCGEQYARAIKLFYRKAGRYPQSVDELKQGIPGVHFLRIEAYKNPMDPEEGTWRFISVNAAGQIIGSVRYATLQQMAYLELNNMQPGQAGAGGSSSAGSSGASYSQGLQSFSQQTSGAASADDGCGPPFPGAPTAGGQNSAGQSSSGATSDNSSGSTANSSPQGGQNSSGTTSSGSPAAFSLSSNQTGQSSIGQPLNGQPVNPYAGLQPTGPVDGPVIGAFITGVGGPTNEDVCSVARPKGARKYSQWEFIWNPVLDQARATQQGLSAAAAATQTGQSSSGGGGTGTNPSPVPPTPSGQQTPPPTTY